MATESTQPQFLTSADPAGPRWVREPFVYADHDRGIDIEVPTDVPLAPSRPATEVATLSEWHTSPAAFLVHSYLYQTSGELPVGTYSKREANRLLRTMLAEEAVGFTDRFFVLLFRRSGGLRWGGQPPEVTDTGLKPVAHRSTGERNRVRFLQQTLLDDYSVTTRDGVSITVRAPFTYDMASVPVSLWSVIAPNALSHPAALIHDFLYRQDPEAGSISLDDPVERDRADRIFRELMERANVPRGRRRVAYRMVRMFGRFSWNKHSKRAAETADTTPRGS